MQIEPVDQRELFGGTVLDPIRDPHSIYRRLRQQDPPLLCFEMMESRTYTLLKYDHVRDMLKNAKLFSSRSNAVGFGTFAGRTIIEMDGKEHIRHRGILAPSLQPAALRGDLPRRIHDICHASIDGFAADGEADLVPQFTFTFPLQVICHLLDIPVKDFTQFHDWASDLISFVTRPGEAIAAAGKLTEFFRPLVRDRKANPRDDLLSRIVNAEIDGHAMAEEEVLSFLKLLAPAGADTTYRLIGITLYALLTHPAQFEEVKADPAKLDLAIDEALRWDSPVQLASRETTEDTEIAGVPIPKGTFVTAGIGSANRDEEHFENPDAYDLHRGGKDHFAFGWGQHFCVGSRLARLEARIALEALIGRLHNLELVDPYGSAPVGVAFRGVPHLRVTFDAD